MVTNDYESERSKYAAEERQLAVEVLERLRQERPGCRCELLDGIRALGALDVYGVRAFDEHGLSVEVLFDSLEGVYIGYKWPDRPKGAWTRDLYVEEAEMPDFAVSELKTVVDGEWEQRRKWGYAYLAFRGRSLFRFSRTRIQWKSP